MRSLKVAFNVFHKKCNSSSREKSRACVCAAFWSSRPRSRQTVSLHLLLQTQPGNSDTWEHLHRLHLLLWSLFYTSSTSIDAQMSFNSLIDFWCRFKRILKPLWSIRRLSSEVFGCVPHEGHLPLQLSHTDLQPSACPPLQENSPC